jgi:hypothetical protein
MNDILTLQVACRLKNYSVLLCGIYTVLVCHFAQKCINTLAASYLNTQG